MVSEAPLEVALLARKSSEVKRGIDATSMPDNERLERIKQLAERTIALWDESKAGRFDDPVAGTQALREAVIALGPRYEVMLSELPRFKV